MSGANSPGRPPARGVAATRRLEVKLTPEEHVRYGSAAAAEGQALSEVVRFLLAQWVEGHRLGLLERLHAKVVSVHCQSGGRDVVMSGLADVKDDRLAVYIDDDYVVIPLSAVTHIWNDGRHRNHVSVVGRLEKVEPHPDGKSEPDRAASGPAKLHFFV